MKDHRLTALIGSLLVVAALIRPLPVRGDDMVAASVARARVNAHLRAAVIVGERALQTLRTAGRLEEVHVAFPAMREMLRHMKEADENLSILKRVAPALAVLVEYDQHRTVQSFGMIRHGLDHTEEPWSQYIAETLPYMERAVAIARELRDSVP